MASDLEALRPHPRTGDEAPVSYRAKHIRSLFDRIAALEAENARMREYQSFVALWCTREDPPNSRHKLTDKERLDVIKHHPTTQAALRNETGEYVLPTDRPSPL